MVNGPNGHHGHHGLWTIAFDHSPWCPLGPLTIVHYFSISASQVKILLKFI